MKARHCLHQYNRNLRFLPKCLPIKKRWYDFPMTKTIFKQSFYPKALHTCYLDNMFGKIFKFLLYIKWTPIIRRIFSLCLLRLTHFMPQSANWNPFRIHTHSFKFCLLWHLPHSLILLYIFCLWERKSYHLHTLYMKIYV